MGPDRPQHSNVADDPSTRLLESRHNYSRSDQARAPAPPTSQSARDAGDSISERVECRPGPWPCGARTPRLAEYGTDARCLLRATGLHEHRRHRPLPGPADVGHLTDPAVPRACLPEPRADTADDDPSLTERPSFPEDGTVRRPDPAGPQAACGGDIYTRDVLLQLRTAATGRPRDATMMLLRRLGLHRPPRENGERAACRLIPV